MGSVDPFEQTAHVFTYLFNRSINYYSSVYAIFFIRHSIGRYELMIS